METTIYNESGKESGVLTLPESIFGLPWNGDLVHQTVTTMLTNKRTNVAHTKNRGDVSGGGKKPWQQKGTGRARHGSTRSPIWVGGGVSHGPTKNKNFERIISKKMMAKTLAIVLSRKLKDGEVVLVDAMEFTAPKTAEAKNIFTALSKNDAVKGMTPKATNCAFIATADKDKKIEKSFKNFGNVSVGEVRNLNPLDVLNKKFLVIVDPKKAIRILEKRLVN